MQEIAACSHEKTTALFKAAVLRDPAGARTQDPNIKSVVLYQLSYGISDSKWKLLSVLVVQMYRIFLFYQNKTIFLYSLIRKNKL